MRQWLLSAQNLSERLRCRCMGELDKDLRSELDQVIELIKQAEMEFGEEENVVMAKASSIVGQRGNISKIFNINEIAYCQSDDKKVFIIDSSYQCYRTNSSLKEIEAQIGSLIKINQSTLVNFEQVKFLEYREDFNHYIVKLMNNSSFRVSRRCTRKVKDLFHGESGLELVS